MARPNRARFRLSGGWGPLGKQHPPKLWGWALGVRKTNEQVLPPRQNWAPLYNTPPCGFTPAVGGGRDPPH